MAYQLTSLGIPVLALLRERPMHGYEMFQTLIQRHADCIVKVRPGSLYHVVDRLTDEKLIRRSATARDGKRPERAIYEITDAGAEALAERVRQLISAPVHEFPQFVVALAEVDTLDSDAALTAVNRGVHDGFHGFVGGLAAFDVAIRINQDLHTLTSSILSGGRPAGDSLAGRSVTTAVPELRRRFAVSSDPLPGRSPTGSSFGCGCNGARR